MSASKYMNKVVNRMEKEFQRRGYAENTYTIDSEVSDRIPGLKITFNDLTYRFSLANEYIAYMEDDISVKDSIKDKITEIFAEITRRTPIDIETEEELNRDLNEEETEERDAEDDDPNRLYAIYEEEIKPYLRLFPVDYAERSAAMTAAGNFWINKGDVIFRIGMEKDGDIKFVNDADAYPFNMEATKYIAGNELIGDAVDNYINDSDISVTIRGYDDGTLFAGVKKNDESIHYSDCGASAIYAKDSMEALKNMYGDFYALPVNKKSILIIPFSVIRENGMTFEGLQDVLKNTSSAIGHDIFYYNEQEKDMKVASGRELEQLREETAERENDTDTIREESVSSEEQREGISIEPEFRYFDTNSKDAFTDELVKYFHWKDPNSEYVRIINEDKQPYRGHDIIRNNTNGIEIETDHAWDIYKWYGYQQNNDSGRFIDTAETLYIFYEEKKPAFMTTDAPRYINTFELSNRILPNEMDMIDTSDPEEAGEEEAQESASVVHFERNGRSDTEIAAEFEDFDTDYSREFVNKLKEFFEWKLEGENISVVTAHLEDNTPVLVIDGCTINAKLYNDDYQSNNESFLQTATRAYNDYKADFLRSMVAEVEVSNEENEEDFIDVEDDYLPF